MDREDARRWTRRLAGYVPVTVAGVALVSWYLAAEGIRYEEVYTKNALNPLAYLLNGLFHADWDHFAGNVRLWIPFGTLLTWLTSNRHVLLLFVLLQALSVATSLAIGQFVVGMSTVVFGVAAAILVRATGIALRDASMETLQVVVAGVFAPVLVGFLFVAIAAGGNTWIAHFAHFFGVLFGGAIEAMYVFDDHDADGSERTVPGSAIR